MTEERQPDQATNFVQVVENENNPSCHVCGALLTVVSYECKSCGASTAPAIPEQPLASARAQGWIKCSERLPELNKKVDVAGCKRLDRGMAYLNEHGEWLIETCSDTINIYPPTHWRELPPEPK